MAFPCRKFLKPKILTCLLAGLSVSILHLWFLGDPRFQPKQRSDGSLQVTHVAPAATSPSSPGPPCVANASANATADFEKLPARIQDFLRYRHCRHFPLLWDAPAKCRGSRGPFLLLAVKSAPANFERRELIRRTWQVPLLGWLEARCPHARFLLSGDDDVFVHTANVLRFLEAKSPDRHLFAGQLMSGSVPIRESWSKYFVPPQLFPGSVYPVYCSGGGDAYMGMCLERVGLKPSGHEGIRPFGVQLPGARQPSFDPCMYRELLLVHRFAPYEMLLMWKALHNPGLSCHQGHRVS
nr:PREDICTED: acetylgalactosaminyl-O-glycosyl-glycoprotein beta-1,3-N-acetylglucosaminyltransferase [Bos mutus]